MTLPYAENPGATHYEGCWRDRGHHNCAVAEVERLADALSSRVRDSERLDWIFSTLNTDEIRARINCVGVEYCERGWFHRIQIGDVRSAIDAAMSSPSLPPQSETGEG